MPATVQIVELNGNAGSETETDKTGGSVRLKKADSAAVDLANPLVKPTAGSDWSFQKFLALKVTGGSYSQMTNVRAYADGANGMGAGVSIWARSAAYATPAQESSAAGYADLFGFTSAAPLVLGAGPFTGVGRKGNCLQLAAQIGTSVAGGLTPSETITIAWDEI